MTKSKTKHGNSRKERGNPENRNAAQFCRQEERLQHAEEVKKLQGTIRKQAKESIEDKATIKQQAKDLCDMKEKYGDACRDRDIHKNRADIFEKNFQDALSTIKEKKEIDLNLKVEVGSGIVEATVAKEENRKNEVILPESLATQEAMFYWNKLQQADLVDENFMPLVSRTQAALIANDMSDRLKISHKWKCFEDFWQRKNMRNDYNSALGQVQSLKFQDLLKIILSE